MTDKTRLTPREARTALVYCVVAFAGCVWLLRMILEGDWEGVFYTSTGQVVELRYILILGAVGAIGGFLSVLTDALPAKWRRGPGGGKPTRPASPR